MPRPRRYSIPVIGHPVDIPPMSITSTLQANEWLDDFFLSWARTGSRPIDHPAARWIVAMDWTREQMHAELHRCQMVMECQAAAESSPLARQLLSGPLLPAFIRAQVESYDATIAETYRSVDRMGAAVAIARQHVSDFDIDNPSEWVDDVWRESGREGAAFVRCDDGSIEWTDLDAMVDVLEHQWRSSEWELEGALQGLSDLIGQANDLRDYYL